MVLILPVPIPVAALVYRESSCAADALLADFARDMLARGRRLHGLVQQETTPPEGERPQRQLADLRTGRLYRLPQDLGPSSQACGQDPGALASASHVLREALQERAELVIVDRYGALEASGGGFAQAMLALMREGIPLLTVVPETLWSSWYRFTGRMSEELPVAREPLQAWFERVAGAVAPSPGTGAP
ncbi:DUF2478 domain-containing protein [Achromobacter denitrificans]